MNRIKEIFLEIWPFMLVLAILCFAILASGCKSVHDLQVIHDTTYINKIEYRDKIIHDSTYVRDSIMVYKNGDTIFLDRWHDRWHDRFIHDSAYIHDTTYVDNEIPVEVVKIVKKTNWTWTILLLAFFLALIWAQKEGFLRKILEFTKGLFHVRN